jgi:peptide chain release factor 2
LKCRICSNDFKQRGIFFASSWCVFDLPAKESQLAELEKEINSPEFWNDPGHAQQVSKQAAGLREQIEDWHGFERRLKDATELAGLDDETLRAELEVEIAGLESELDKRSFTAMLSGPYDAEDALLAIHAGAGGTDSQDWASMLLRMYLRWAEQQGYTTEIWDMTEGEEAGDRKSVV